jgi:hypothetical protein
MTKKNKIILGAGIVGIAAYYLWTLSPTAGGQECSTRYIKMDISGLVDAETLGIPEHLRESFDAYNKKAFESYKLALLYWSELSNLHPEETKIPQSLRDSEAEKDAKKLLNEFNTKFGKDGDIVSGYRSWEKQIDNFKNKVSGSRDVNDVQNSNSIPGFSQHHSGKCFDIYSVNLSDWTEEMKNWVEENVGKYGFKVTYKENVDGRIAEPWHIAKEEVEFTPINNWNQWCQTKGEEKKEVTFKNFDFDKLENQNLKGSGLFKLLLIIFGIGKLMTPEGREFLKKIKERLFSKKEESVSVGSSDVLGYPLREFSDRLCGGCTYGRPRDGGRRSHAGIDLAAKSGTEVLAPLDGEVFDSAIRDNACGGTIAVDHGNINGKKIKTRFCHNSKLLKNKGDTVKKGDVIAISGGGRKDVGRGTSTGPHIHFEEYENGSPVNPKQ